MRRIGRVGLFIKKHLKIGKCKTPDGEEYTGFKFTMRW